MEKNTGQKKLINKKIESWGKEKIEIKERKKYKKNEKINGI